MTNYPVIIQIGKKRECYSIPAFSPGEALAAFKKQLSITMPDTDFDGNYELIYFLHGRKKYALVFADNPREAMKKLKEKIGEDKYKKVTIAQITELNKEL